MGRRTQSREIAARYGLNLRRERQRVGLTQARVADRAGVRRPAVSLLEAGRQAPTVELTFRLGGALGVHPAVLLNGMSWDPETDEFIIAD